jgi:pyrroline-5-carboxylate reductase
MLIDRRIGIIGGKGWLGSAIAEAMVAGGRIDPARLILSSRSDRPVTGAIRGAYLTKDNDELVERSDVIFLSVRPDQFADLRISAKDKLVISVMAAVTAQKIADLTGAVEIIRSMPNAAAAIRQSFTPWYATPAVSEDNKDVARSLLEALGDAAEVSLESHIDYCTGMTGSGAAFPALLARAMIEHAVAQGLPLEFAERAATGVVAGASQLMRAPEGGAMRIVKDMLDYRGTTAAALQTMIDRGFVDAVRAGLEAASLKASALGQQLNPRDSA